MFQAYENFKFIKTCSCASEILTIPSDLISGAKNHFQFVGKSAKRLFLLTDATNEEK